MSSLRNTLCSASSSRLLSLRILLSAYCSPHSWVMSSSLAVQIVPQMRMVSPHSWCQIYFIAQAPTGSRCPYLIAKCLSPSGHPNSFKMKLIIFPLNQVLLLPFHSRSHLRVPVTQARNVEIILESIFILIPHTQTIINACQFCWQIFPKLRLPFSSDS